MSSATSNKENHKYHNYNHEISKPLTSHGDTALRTITGQATNGRFLAPSNRSNQKIRVDYESKIIPEFPFDELRVGYSSLFESHSGDEDEDYSPFRDMDEVDRMLPGVLAAGVAYTVKQTICEGYLEKKGSGFDWIGSRAWKRRWAVLVRARTDGHDVDVPLLQIFWDYHSPTPSTVISLDSAVVLPENNFDTSKPENVNRMYRFKIRHLKKSVNPEISVQLTRILGCAGAAERDNWIYSINQALLTYEKEKASAKRLSSLSLSPPRGNFRAWVNEDVMPQPSRIRQTSSSSPPRIPVCSRKDIRR